MDMKFTLPSLSNSRGFTLIETLVALMILAISLVTIMQLFSGGLKSSMVSDSYTRAIFHAREKMAEILLAPDLSEGDTQGEFEDAYQWRAVIARVVPEEAEENLPFNLLNVKIRINWREGEKEKSFVIDTLKAAEKEKGS